MGTGACQASGPEVFLSASDVEELRGDCPVYSGCTNHSSQIWTTAESFTFNPNFPAPLPLVGRQSAWECLFLPTSRSTAF